jgi:hypothetical protein
LAIQEAIAQASRAALAGPTNPKAAAALEAAEQNYNIENICASANLYPHTPIYSGCAMAGLMRRPEKCQKRIRINRAISRKQIKDHNSWLPSLEEIPNEQATRSRH